MVIFTLFWFVLGICVGLLVGKEEKMVIFTLFWFGLGICVGLLVAYVLLVEAW